MITSNATQGSWAKHVSALVARFQTAANRDQDAALRESRRTSLSSRRASSNVPSGTSASTSPAPPTPASLPTEPAPPRQAAGPAQIDSNVKAQGAGEQEGKSELDDGVQEKKGVGQQILEKAEGVKNAVLSGGKGASTANEDMAASAPPLPLSPSKPVSTVAPNPTSPTTVTPQRAHKDNSGRRTTPSATNKENTSISTTGYPSSASGAKGVPAGDKTPVRKVSGGKLARRPDSSTHNEVTNMPVITDSDVTSKKSSPVQAKHTPSSIKAKTNLAPKPNVGSAKPLIPSKTGPATSHREPSHSSSHATAPLRPQLTGTPSKPTASSLAKARSPPVSTSSTSSNRRQSMPHSSGSSIDSPAGAGSGLGRSTSVLGGRGRVGSMSPSPSSAGNDGGLPKRTPSSSSRLLQGTAASRARAASNVNSTPSKATGSPGSSLGKASGSRLVHSSSAGGSTSTGREVKVHSSGEAAAASTSGSYSLGSKALPQTGPVGRSPIGRIGLAGGAPKRNVGGPANGRVTGKGAGEGSGYKLDEKDKENAETRSPPANMSPNTTERESREGKAEQTDTARGDHDAGRVELADKISGTVHRDLETTAEATMPSASGAEHVAEHVAEHQHQREQSGGTEVGEIPDLE